MLLVSSDTRVATQYRTLAIESDNTLLHVLENSGQYENWDGGKEFNVANGNFRFVRTDATEFLRHYHCIVFAEQLSVQAYSGRSPLTNLAYTIIRKAAGFHWRKVSVVLHGGTCDVFRRLLDGGGVSTDALPSVEACT